MSDLPEHFVDSRDFARIGRAIRYIEARYREQPSLKAVAGHVGLSEFHFNRLFRRWAGVTPKQYLAFVTESAAKRLLAAQASVLDAAYAVGLSGASRLYDLVVTLEAMTPGELKAQGAGVAIRYGFSDSPFGRALIGETARGLCHLSFVEPEEEGAAVARLQEAWPGARIERQDELARSAALRIWGGSQGRDAEPLRLVVSGTNLQLKVWQALIELGARERTTYGEIATAIGAPRSVRAVGNAVSANRIAWLIPCHNVLRKSGALGGYRWGEDRKRAMLAWKSLTGGTTVSAPSPDREIATRRP